MFRVVRSLSFVVSWSSVRSDGGTVHESSWGTREEAQEWLLGGPFAADPTFIAAEIEERFQYAVESDDGRLRRPFHYSSDVYDDCSDLPLHVDGEASLSAAVGYVESGGAFRDWTVRRRVDRLQAMLRQRTMYFVSQAWVSRERAAAMQFAARRRGPPPRLGHRGWRACVERLHGCPDRPWQLCHGDGGRPCRGVRFLLP